VREGGRGGRGGKEGGREGGREGERESWLVAEWASHVPEASPCGACLDAAAPAGDCLSTITAHPHLMRLHASANAPARCSMRRCTHECSCATTCIKLAFERLTLWGTQRARRRRRPGQLHPPPSRREQGPQTCRSPLLTAVHSTHARTHARTHKKAVVCVTCLLSLHSFSSLLQVL